MLYNRHSICALHSWVKFALLKGRPWKSLSWVMWHHQESIATTTYTRSEIFRMFSAMGLQDVRVDAFMMQPDSTLSRLPFIFRPFVRAFLDLTEYWLGWAWSFMPANHSHQILKVLFGGSRRSH